MIYVMVQVWKRLDLALSFCELSEALHHSKEHEAGYCRHSAAMVHFYQVRSLQKHSSCYVTRTQSPETEVSRNLKEMDLKSFSSPFVVQLSVFSDFSRSRATNAMQNDHPSPQAFRRP